MKKVIELIPNTKVEINTDGNGRSVILYSDNKEEESKFNDGDFISEPSGTIAIYKNNNVDCDGFNLYASICDYTSIVSYSVTGYNIDKWGLASDYEIQKLKEALKNKGYYWDKEAKEIREIGKFNEGDYVIFKTSNQLHKGIIYDIYNGKHECCDIFIPLEPNTFYRIYMKGCFHPTAVDIEEIEFQMLKIGKKWNGKKIVDIVWIPKVGEYYYYINSSGEIRKTRYDIFINWGDKAHIDFGNAFKTEEEATLYRNKIKELLTKRNK